MVKGSRSKHSNRSIGNNPDTDADKGSTTRQTRSGGKGKRARQYNRRGKRASNKTRANKTKRTGRKTGGGRGRGRGRKGARHEEHGQTQAHETVATSNE
jgi:hypothetical protein